MAAAKETPRQRMISMMYLVLTALLALNVSKDVLNAFVVVNDTILESNTNLSYKLDEIYANFEKNYLFNQDKVKPYWEKAQEARSKSEEIINFIKNIRYELISETESIPIDSAKVISLQKLKRKDNFTVPTNYFIGSSLNNYNGAAKQLKDKLGVFREEMLKLVDEKNLSNFKIGLDTEGSYYNADGKEESWETHFFYNTIQVADVAILNKIISDVHNAEFDVVDLLHKSIGQGDFKFDKIEARIIPENKLIFSGDQYTAEIIVAAYDTSQSPEVYYLPDADYLSESQIGKAKLIEGKSGKIAISFPTGSEGLKKYAGLVRVKMATDVINDFHFTGEYMVTKPSYSISAKKMNVFYIGVPNPVSIDIAGIPRENLLPSISCGTIKPDPTSNDWIVTIPANCTDAVIKLSATINGEQKQFGSKIFRIKKLPDPSATIANKNSGVINRDILIAAGFLSPKMPDDFEFDHTFVISSFTMTIQRGFKVYNFNSKNAYLTNEMIEQLKLTNRGQSIVFENIIARDSDGETRNIPPIVLSIN